MAAPSGIVPAQLGFFAIFNPSLGLTDDTLDDQIVYYASVTTQTSSSSSSSSRRRRRPRARPTDAVSQAERHERLRQIGLAQGMVHFGRGFSAGATVDAIDTHKTRVVAHEVEPGWWILASVDLNKVPLPPRLPTKPGERPEERFEYTSREMKPAQLLLRDLLRAHGVFLLHHDDSLGGLWERCGRARFVAILGRYWDLFLSTWSVMLHGNPVREVFGGINVAASGELGVGVGEEARGSGEREVLEGLVGRVEGLVDLVVSKFGEEADCVPAGARTSPRGGPRAGGSREPEPWLGGGKEPSVEDGAIFLGTGALSRRSLRDVAHWMEDLYTWGEHAYGVIDSSGSTRARATKTTPPRTTGNPTVTAEDDTPSKPVAKTTTGPEDAGKPVAIPERSRAAGHQRDGSSGGLVSYLTLGYGSYWSLPGALTGGASTPPQASPSRSGANDAAHRRLSVSERPSTNSTEPSGHYLIGLRGELEEETPDDVPESRPSSRTVLRTVHVELARDRETTTNRDLDLDLDLQGKQGKTSKLRIVVYVNRPFIFTFLFRPATDALALDALYRSLHYQLAPLRRPLLSSTKFRPGRPDAGGGSSASSIHDLVWDPSLLTVHCTVPNIPAIYNVVDSSSSSWSRADAVSTHINLLGIYAATRGVARHADAERTQKTSRGWWIVWTRVLRKQQGQQGQHGQNLSVIHEHGSARSSSSSLVSQRSRRSSRSPAGRITEGKEKDKERQGFQEKEKEKEKDREVKEGKEIYLIRRASDHAGYLGGREDGAEGRLAQGIGVDTRRYVEELLSLF